MTALASAWLLSLLWLAVLAALVTVAARIIRTTHPIRGGSHA